MTVAIDIMHCFYLGILKKLASLWMDSQYKSEDWSLYKHVKQIDTQMQAIHMPASMRNFRSYEDDGAHWKGVVYICISNVSQLKNGNCGAILLYQPSSKNT
jgi:hypothetical protein